MTAINDFISILLSNVLFVIIMVSLLKFKITQNHKITYECQIKVSYSVPKLRYASLNLNIKTFTTSHKIT